MIKRLLPFICLLLWAIAAQGAEAILVFGDSLSAAYGIPPERGWVALLDRRLQDRHPGYRVVNASISGETTSGGRNRIEPALAEFEPAIVILELGANDGLRGQSLDIMRANLDAIIAASKRQKARVLLIGMRLPPNYGTPYATKFQNLYVQAARRHKIPLLPFLFEGFASRPGLFLADGVHPTAEAQPLIMEMVWERLQPMLATSQ